MHSRQAFTRTELVVVLLIWGVLGLLLLPAVEHARNPKGPHGEMVPIAPPIESNRITHATGLSIVAPVNWDQTRDWDPGTPSLCVAARGTPGRRLTSFITVQLSEPNPDLASCRQVQFQGTPAYEKTTVDREDTFDDPASSSYDLYVERNGTRWHVQFIIAKRMTELPNSIRLYLETIRFPETEKPSEPPDSAVAPGDATPALND